MTSLGRRWEKLLERKPGLFLKALGAPDLKSPVQPKAPTSSPAPGAQLHSTVGGFMQGLHDLPKGGPERGKFVTSHMQHAPFLQALSKHPQGAVYHKQLTDYMNSSKNAHSSGAGAKVTTSSTGPSTVGVGAAHAGTKMAPGMMERLQAKMAKSDRLQGVPAGKLYLNINPNSDHHGHGFWAGKYDPEREQIDYVEDEQDEGQPMLEVVRHYDGNPEPDDETIKSIKQRGGYKRMGKRSNRIHPRIITKRGSSVHKKSPLLLMDRAESLRSTACSTPRSMSKLEPSSLRKLHGHPPRRAKILYVAGKRQGSHPVILIRPNSQSGRSMRASTRKTRK